MIILGIESSCDETAASIVEDGQILHSHVVASSVEMHAKYGGIIPDKAAREQLKSIIPAIHESLAANPYPLDPKDIDAIAVTVGPGLVGSLLVGVETAKTLSYAWNKKIIPVNHLVGHIYANWLIKNNTPLSLSLSDHQPELPAIVLLVSGGHTDLVFMEDHGKITRLGSTRDDAAGECFDKCGRVLGLPYPYGPFIEKESEKFIRRSSELVFNFPRPLHDSKDYDFSFSGLKTAFLNKHTELKDKNYDLLVPHLAYELQEAITDSLISKTFAAWEKYKTPSILLAGGVAANKVLRSKLSLAASRYPLSPKVYIPPLKLCTDNASYIASAAFYNQKDSTWREIEANPEMTITSF